MLSPEPCCPARCNVFVMQFIVTVEQINTLWGIKTHQNVFRHNFRKTRRILNKIGRLFLK